MSGDPYYANVSLLLPMTGSNGSTTFADSSPSPKAVTANGGAQISTAQSKWGNGSGYFDGSGDYLQGQSGVLSMGTADFTIECWARLNSYAQCSFWESSPIGSPGGRSTGFIWYLIPGGTMYIYSNGSNRLSVSSGIPLSQWTHVALVRNNNTWTIYIDGTSKGSSIYSLNDTAGGIAIGPFCDGGNFAIDGYINDFRVTKEVARYAANFTPPDAPFPTFADLTCNAFLMEPGGPLTCAPAAIAGPPQGFLMAEPNRAYDIEDGGRAVVEGIVTLNGVPGARKVRLHTLNNGRLIREAWSDPVSGAYRFDHLKDQPYYVWSEDYARIYDPVSHLVANSPG